MIDKDTIQRVKDAASIVDVIGDFYHLKKKGAAYQCLCPFHEDRHLGSFVVSPRLNTFYCFSCGEHGGCVDFIMRHEKLSFPDAIRWLGHKYSISTDDEGRQWAHKPKAAMPHIPPPPLPLMELPMKMVQQTRREGTRNVLVEWIKSLPWSDAQRGRIDKMLAHYAIGTTRDGKSIFWQIDDKNRVRAGKIMEYGTDGHRVKNKSLAVDWVHSRLVRAGQLPADYREKMDFKQCLFGLHLIDSAKPTTVNIVESEKTALLCAIAYGGMEKRAWMATGGLEALTSEKIQPLLDRGCYIYLYADHEERAQKEWSEFAASMNNDHVIFDTQFYPRWFAAGIDPDKVDIADIIIRLISQQPETRRAEKTQTVAEVLAEMVKEYPVIQTMIDKFDLVPE